MPIDQAELVAALKAIDPIVLSDIAAQGEAVLNDSSDYRRRAVQIARDLATLSENWLTLRAKATTPEGQAVFDKRLVSAVSEIQGVVNLSPGQKVIIKRFTDALLG